MVVYNYTGKEINAKVVYYGPALSGKTTNLEWIYSKIPVEYSGKMVSLRTQADRTIFFDFLPLDLGVVDGFRTRFMLYTVPGQVHYNATRKMVLKGVDGVVFVADSEPSRMRDNLESLENLRENLRELGIDPDSIPVVLQWNKRDLPNCMSVAELETELNPRGLPSFEACALTGEGVYETLHKVCRSIYTKLTGTQAGVGEEDPPLFGESIAQCLQDVDVPEPEPERVAIGAEEGALRAGANQGDPLQAILGRAGGGGGSPDEPLRGSARGSEHTPTREIRPVTSGPDGPSVAMPHEVSSGSVSHSSGDVEAARLGGLVDDVLSSLDERPSPASAGPPDDVASIDRHASSRSVPAEPAPTSSSVPAPDVSTSLTVEDILGSSPDPVPHDPPNPQPGSPDTGVPEGGFSVEHDVDIFSELGKSSSSTPPAAEEEAGIDLDDVLQERSADEAPSPSQDLELITDPRRLPGERSDASSPLGISSSSAGFSKPVAGSRVLEVPVTIDASLLEEGGPVRIVLNLSVRH